MYFDKFSDFNKKLTLSGIIAAGIGGLAVAHSEWKKSQTPNYV